MNLKDIIVNPIWRTDTVVALCLGMRETQNFDACPILADALQDAGCGNEILLNALRTPKHKYATFAGMVGCVLSKETEDTVQELLTMSDRYSYPNYEILVAAAVGKHDENAASEDEPYSNYYRSENDGEYLHFGGVDAHGEIPANFWDLVQKATGKIIPNTDRATYFSCSC